MSIIWFAQVTVAFLLSTALSLAILVPFAGIIVRFRVNYSPKALGLGPEDDAIGVRPDGGEDGRVVGPKITSLFGMLMRVWRIEGWKGLYKGFMPIYLLSLINGIFTFIYIWVGLKAYKDPHSIPLAPMVASAAVMTLIGIPFGILTNRAITTPYKLPAFAPRLSLRLLLTAYERRRPWVLYFTPGLVLALSIQIFFAAVISPLVRWALVPALFRGIIGPIKDGTLKDVSTVRLTLFILIQTLAGTTILTPLAVMAARLSIQPNFAPGVDSEQEDAELIAAQAGVEHMGQSEDVLNLRSNSGEEPYKSLWHCMQRIVDEEGVGALFRVWWLTMLGTVAAGLA